LPILLTICLRKKDVKVCFLNIIWVTVRVVKFFDFEKTD